MAVRYGGPLKRAVTFHVPLAVTVGVTLFPFYWMVITSIRPDRELYSVKTNPFFTLHPTLEHFRNLFELTLFPQWAWNTIFIATVSTAISLFCGLLAGLQTVNPDLHEAAQIDGANAWQRFWRVTLPLIKPIMLVVVLFSMIATFADFQLIYVLTRGGPYSSTHVFGTYAYEIAMRAAKLGQGASISLSLFPFLLMVIIFQLWYIRRSD